MTFPAATDTVPLKRWDDGTIRVGDSRVTLDILIEEWRAGFTPEQIAVEFDTLELRDIYSAIAYVLGHQEEVDEYLRVRAEFRARIEAENRARSGQDEWTAQLRDRWAKRAK